ncbi:hypothetical protein GDO86_006795 [Hymenochirus boettgeri]|uniref:G-protein coupled receptors family 1 profile domain-containing protein n=1 Tax=Hymenochirus boettgeri TaxID=247094 RepID=A0A8T2JA05_9PIPI|nr:hypothetical protein GDO86_006795 [Hymenochirus boettgeri]
MENKTFMKGFQLSAFSNTAERRPLLFLVFFLIYMIGVLGNIAMIIITFVDDHLHTPMYYFLCNLSAVDIMFNTATLSKLMDILISGNKSMSIKQCLSQLYFFVFAASTEDTLLPTMAYDRYVAISNPLHYHFIMNTKSCLMLLIGNWISGCFNSLILTLAASRLTLCSSNNIKHFFCDIKALQKISCPNITFLSIIYIEAIVLGLCPFLLSLTSYIKIIKIVMRIKSKIGRRKAFSTCSSHFTVLLIFYGAAMCMYMRPPSQHSEEFDQVFSVLFVAVTPVLNPLIYSLRNKEVKEALARFVGFKKKNR